MAKKVYVGANVKTITLKNLFPAISGKTGFTTATGVTASSTHTKYATTALRINGTTSTTERTATSSSTYSLNADHKYYARVEVYQETVVGSTALYWPVGEPPFYSGKVATSNQWTTISAVNTRSSFTSGNYAFRLDFDNNKKAGYMWFDGLMLIDLTACFGYESEPTVEWCDANIPYFADTYVIEENTTSGHARNVNKIYVGVNGIARRVKKAYVGVAGVARLCYLDDSPAETLNDGTCWVLLKDGWTKYDSNGNAVETGAYGTWPCPSAGAYTVEIHGGGGGASGSLFPENDDPVCKGGNGGGSGAIYLLSLSAKTYSYSIGPSGQNGRSSMVDSANTNWGSMLGEDGYDSTFDVYTVKGGLHGGRANIEWGEYYHGGPGAAGEATFGYIEFLGEAGGSGNSSIGNYGDGGTTGFTGNDPVEGAIIIRKASRIAVYEGTATSLASAVTYHAGTSVGGYALFGGGENASKNVVSTVNAYNKELTRTSPTTLSVARSLLYAEKAGDYALFAGGRNSSDADVATTDAYNTSLTRTVLSTGLSNARSEQNGPQNSANVAGYALIGGGSNNASSIDVFTSTLTKGANISNGAFHRGAGASINGHAFFAGGENKDGTYVQGRAVAINSSLTKTTLTTITAREALSAASTGNYVLFAGGYDFDDDEYNDQYYDEVEAFNSSYTKYTCTPLVETKKYLGSLSMRGIAVFAGGLGSTAHEYEGEIEVFDSSLTKTVHTTTLSQATMQLVGANVSSYGLLSGGRGKSASIYDTVYVFSS